MRLFEEYGTPSTAGDITYIDYLFLGDYVDRWVGEEGWGWGKTWRTEEGGHGLG